MVMCNECQYPENKLFNVLYPTCDIYDISTSLQMDYSFSLIIGVLGLFVWKPGLKPFIDN